MVAHRVLLVDDNQIFGSQVVAAFAEAWQQPGSKATGARPSSQIEATWVPRGGEALLLLNPELAASQPADWLRPQLVILDFVRPASGGRQLLAQLQALRRRPPEGYRPPLVLVLVPVLGSFSDLPEGVEVQVKPIFPSQVVASARRLLGMVSAAPPSSGLGRAEARPVVSHQLSLTPAPLAPLPASGSPLRLPGRAIDDIPTAAHVSMSADATQDVALDQFEDSSDFGPADTLLGPSNIEELARAMTRSAPTGDDLLDAPTQGFSSLAPDWTAPAWSAEEGTARPSSDGAAESVRPPRSVRIPTRRQFPALGSELIPGASKLPAKLDEDLGEAQTELLPRSSDLGSAAAAARVRSPAQASLAGDIAVIPLIDVIALLARQQQSGLLEIISVRDEGQPAISISIAWRDGRIDQCLASGLPQLCLGRFAAEAAPLSHAQIDELATSRPAAGSGGPQQSSPRSAPQNGELLGQKLCRDGLLRPDELRQVLARQSTELLYEALRLRSGQFHFDHLAKPPHYATTPELGGALGLDAEALLLEGYRRVRDYHLLAKDVKEGAVYVSTAPSSEPVNRLGLSHNELVVLGLCNGRLNQADIARESHLLDLEVARTIQRLQALRLVRRRLPALLAS